MTRVLFSTIFGVSVVAFLAGNLISQESNEGFADRPLNDDQTYRLFEPKSEQREYKLLVILPGGGGGAAFTPWCQTIYRMGIPDDFIVAQMIAPTWKTPGVTWPSEFSPTSEMKTPIEKLFAEVVTDVQSQHTISEGEIYTLSWSSGGPAAYLIAATQKEVKGHFVAMSVFRDVWLPKRFNQVRGQRFFLYHSPEDQVCPIELAEEGKDRLEKAGAEVKIQTYSGGHGWAQGNDHFGAIRAAFEWLIEN